MDILTIKYFLSLARCLNFSQAAEENHISQSSFSKAIMRLERDLNVKLIDRRNHPVVLTPAGKCFYDHMSVLEPQYQQAMEALENMVKGETIHVLICPNSYQYKMAFAEYMKRHSDIRIQTDADRNLNSVAKRAESDKYDFVITPKPLVLDDALQVTPVYDDEVYLLTSEHSPFARLESVSIRDLSGLDFYQSSYSKQLLYVLSQHFHVQLGKVYPQEGGEEMRREECIHRITLNTGVGMYAGRDLVPYRNNHMRAVPIREMASLPVVLLERKDRQNSPAKNQFRRWLLENLESFITPRMDIREFNRSSSSK